MGIVVCFGVGLALTAAFFLGGLLDFFLGGFGDLFVRGLRDFVLGGLWDSFRAGLLTFPRFDTGLTTGARAKLLSSRFLGFLSLRDLLSRGGSSGSGSLFFLGVLRRP